MAPHVLLDVPDELHRNATPGAWPALMVALAIGGGAAGGIAAQLGMPLGPVVGFGLLGAAIVLGVASQVRRTRRPRPGEWRCPDAPPEVWP